MESNIKLTTEQIKAMQEYLLDLSLNNTRKNEDLGIYYNLLTPKDIYIKYKSFSVMFDNSIMSKIELLCVMPNGEKKDFSSEFDNLKQRLEFESGLMEIDLDANAKIIFL